MFKSLGYFILFFTITISNVYALAFIEPMAGYATGSGDVDITDILTSTTTSGTYNVKGFNYGIRGGLELGSFQLGLDYVKNQMKATGDLEDDFKVDELAGLIGLRFWFLRVYGGYIFSADIKDSDIAKGDGYKFGISFYALSHMALNLEYRHAEFIDGMQGGLANLTYSTTALMLSFPFSI